MKNAHRLLRAGILALGAAAAGLLPVTAAADDITSPDALRNTAALVIQQRAHALGRVVTVSVNELDPRLRLAACTQPLESFIGGDGELHEYTTVGIRCGGTIRWAIYLRAAVSTEISVMTARSALTRGTEPAATDFEISRRTVPGLGSQYTSDYSSVRGQRLRLSLAAGEPLTRDKLEVAAIIRRGQKVTLLVKSGGLEIRVAAIALADGRPAEHIQVQNESSRQVVDAVVRDATVVEVPL